MLFFFFTTISLPLSNCIKLGKIQTFLSIFLEEISSCQALTKSPVATGCISAVFHSQVFRAFNKLLIVEEIFFF